MKIVKTDDSITLIAGKNKYLFNGDCYVKEAELGKNDSKENWVEVDSIPTPEVED